MEERSNGEAALTRSSAVRASVPRGSGAAIIPPVTAADTRLAMTSTTNTVHLVDVEERHIRRPSDLMSAATVLLAITLVLLLSYLGPETAAGVTEDVQDVVDRTARQILLLPVAILQAAVVFFIPVSVLGLHMFRRQWRVITKALIAMLIAYVATYFAARGLELLGATNPLNLALAQNFRGVRVPALAPFVAAMAALLTAVGQRASSRLVRASWWALILVVVLAVLQGHQSLAGALVSALLGQLFGYLARYFIGVRSTRAAGLSLIRGLRRAGLDPDLVVRLDSEPTPLRSWLITSSAPVGYNGSPAATAPAHPASATTHEHTPSGLDELVNLLREADDLMVPNPLPLAEDVDRIVSEWHASAQAARYRTYAVFERGHRVDVSVLDGDRQVTRLLSSLWESIRLRGVNRAIAANLREAADRATLLTLATRAAGLNVPASLGVAPAGDSMLLVREHVSGHSLAALEAEEITDAALNSIWKQLRQAHNAGISNRTLTATGVLVDHAGEVWLMDWDSGEIAATELSRRLDMAQLLTMLATRVGIDRAIASASATLNDVELSMLAPLLQWVILPAETRRAMAGNRRTLGALRAELVRLVPAVADAAPVTLKRVTLRQLLTVSAVFAAILVLFSTFNWTDVAAAFRSANPWWLLAAYLAGLSAHVGAAISLKWFTPEPLKLGRTILVQFASAIVSLVAPAGIGPAAIEIRYLTKERVGAGLAIATVSMIQVTKFFSTIGFLILVSVLAGVGPEGDSVALPSGALMIVISVILALLAILIAIPPVRNWVARQFGPTMRQIWPRILWVFGNPARLGVGLLGNVMQIVAFVAAFGFTLAAFGYSLPVATLSITYLVSASASSIIPSPAGIGPVELALTSGLTIAGIPSAVAVSVTLVFRVLTVGLRVPVGWLSLRYLQKHELL